MSDEHDKGPDAPDPDAPDDGGPESDASLQPAGQLDAPVIAALQNDAFPDEPWTQQAVAFLMSARESIAWIATGRDYGEVMPVGYALGKVAADEAEILTIAVLPEARSKGLGRRLVEAVADKARAAGARRIFLEVSEENQAARRLYDRLGFVEVGRRQGYYQLRDGRQVDALTLARDL